MNEVSYFIIRAQHYSQLAMDEMNPRLKVAFEAIAADMSAKVATADPHRQVVLIDGVTVDMSNDIPHKLQLARGTE